MAEKTIHVCDRCGAIMESTVSGTQRTFTRKATLPQKIVIKSVNKYGYISDKEALESLPNAESVEVTLDYNVSRKSYDLCPDCAKALSRFMNERQ